MRPALPLALPLALALTAACAGPRGARVRAEAAAAPSALSRRLLELGAGPCARRPTFLCLTLSLPLDPGSPRPDRTVRVTFAVQPAPDATRRGMIVTAVGGPGYAGTDGERYPFRPADPRFAAEQDLVFFDLRGVGESGRRDCPKAAAAFYRGGLRAATEAEEAALDARSATFASACVSEMGIAPGDLPYYATAFAVEDLEAFRALVGEERLTLHGFSYGTQFAQTYAARHPDHVRALLLDGTVDLARGHVDYMIDLARTVDGLLARTLADCAARPDCAAAFDAAPGATPGARVEAGYEALASKLERSPVTVAYPLAGGGTSPRLFGRADLDTVSFNAMYDPDGRRAFQTALGVAVRQGDLLPLQRLTYEATGVDPETAGPVGTAAADPGMSDGMYYAFTCNDYGSDAATLDERRALWRGAGRALRGQARALAPFWGDYPCVHWPVTASAKPAAPPALPDVPTMILGATGDGAVPVDQGRAVFARLRDGYLVELDGGAHVLYGRGDACVDDAATAFLLDGKRPVARTTRCQGTFVAP